MRRRRLSKKKHETVVTALNQRTITQQVLAVSLFTGI